VRFFVAQGRGGTWRESDAWPPRDAARARLHLAPSDGRRGRLVEEAPVQSARSSLRYDPRDPTPTLGGKLFGPKAGAKDHRAIVHRTDVLHFESAPLASDVEIAGPVQARLFVGADAAPADFALHLIDVSPKGKRLGVCDGIVRVTSPQRDEAGAGEVVVSLAHAGWRFRAGHRVALHVAPANCPRFARARPVVADAASGEAPEAAPTTQWLACAPEAPSCVELTLAPGARLVFGKG
jgi:putative CocE/NonD family hydrolase